MNKQANTYRVRAIFAKENRIPVIIAGTFLIETQKAVYFYGHGNAKMSAARGICMSCGRTLTHPISVTLGVGPECGGHFYDWDLVGGYSEENVAALSKMVEREIKVDCWIPKSHLSLIEEGTEEIEVPNEHPMLCRERVAPAKAPKTATLSGSTIIIKFPFDQKTLSEVKSLRGRQYHKTADGHSWTAPLSAENAEALAQFKFTLCPALSAYLDASIAQEAKFREAAEKQKVKAAVAAEKATPTLTLLPFQVEGVKALHAAGGRALLADDMGLGKTCQALTWLREAGEVALPAVVVCPASLKINWQEECRMWAPALTTQILSGKDFTNLGYADITIVNYDILANKLVPYVDTTGKKRKKEVPGTGWVDHVLKLIRPRTVLIDEAHMISNAGTARTTSTKKLGRAVKHIIGITGTPVEAKPFQAFNILRMVAPDITPGYNEYIMKFCDAKWNGFAWDKNGHSNMDEFHALMKSVMVRRLKKDVLTQLPEKWRTVIHMKLANRKEYDRASTQFSEWLKEQAKGTSVIGSQEEALTRIGYLRQLCVAGKLEDAIAWVKDFLEGEDKIILFAIHKKVVEALMHGLKAYGPVKLTGECTPAQKQAAVNSFQHNPECRVFVGNIQAAGVGHTLTASNNVAFVELPWTPGALDQAEDRAHRIGQTKEVNVFYLMARNSIEDDIMAMLDSKRKVVDAAVDGKKTQVDSLLQQLAKKVLEVAA